jgi:hypothetical protein
LCEWPAMDALRQVIDDDQDSLGTQVHIAHRAPVCAGTQLTITARCASVTGHTSRWDVSVCAGTQPVASGWVQFAVVHTPAFVQRHGLQPTPVGGRRRPGDDLATVGDRHPALAGTTPRPDSKPLASPIATADQSGKPRGGQGVHRWLPLGSAHGKITLAAANVTTVPA